MAFLLHGCAQEDNGLPLRHVSHLALQFEAAAAVSPALHGISAVPIWQGGKSASTQRMLITGQHILTHHSMAERHGESNTARGQKTQSLLIYTEYGLDLMGQRASVLSTVKRK